MDLFKNIDHSIVEDRFRTGIYNHIQRNFMESFSGDTFFGKSVKLETKFSPHEIISRIREHFSSDKLEVAFYHMEHVVLKNENVLMFLHFNETHDEYFPDYSEHFSQSGQKKIQRVILEIYSNENTVVELAHNFKKLFVDDSFTRISWFFKDTHGVDNHSLYIEQEHPVYDEFYPWLKGGVNHFVESYINSNASVLVLYGPPGTGKTSFLKHMLCSRKLSAVVSYDEDVLNDDRFFIDFLTQNEHDIMIIEDADLLLSSRETDHNKIMNRFLNVSDGMVKVLNKKMVFTTNLSQLNKVDQALLRKGRCFGAIEFRRLTSEEAAKVGECLSLPEIDYYKKRDWSLAEICNQDEIPAVVAPVRKMGF